MTKKNPLKMILIVLGLLTVFTTHIAIIAVGLPQEMLGGHATLNIVAGIMIGAGVTLK